MAISPHRKKNVLFVIIQMEMGGSERLVLNLASHLDRSIFNPSIAWFFGDTPLKEFRDLEIPLYHVPKNRRIDWSSMRRLARIISRNRIDVVNAHHFMSMVYAYYGCRWKRAGLVYTEHSEWEIDRISRRWKSVGRFLVNHMESTVGVNGPVTEKLKKAFRVSDGRVTTILNGVHLKAFHNEGAVPHVRDSLNLRENDFVIAVVGNLKKVKNHLFLLRAFKEMVETAPHARLLIVGQGFADDPENTEVDLREYVRDNDLKDQVFFLGYRDDVPKILGVADTFCLTSYMEGLPISLIEAMASGLPVVGTNVAGIKGLIVPNENGFLVDPDDIGSLKQTLLDLMRNEDLRRSLGKAGQVKAQIMYSFERCVREYERIFLAASHLVHRD